MVFAWAALEGICWFVIPEFLLLLIIFLRVKNKTYLIFFDILGTLFGTILGLMIFKYSNFDILKVPYITQGMIDKTFELYNLLGLATLFSQPFSGIPYKVFLFCAKDYELNLLVFLLLAVFVRTGRYYIFYVLFDGIYPFLHNLISRNYIPIFLLSCFLFSCALLKVYNFYL